MGHHFLHQDRRRYDPRKLPRLVQSALTLLLVTFAGLTCLIGWWADSSGISTASVLYRAILLEVMLVFILGMVARLLLLRFLIFPLHHKANYDDLTDLMRPGSFWDQAESVIEQAAADGVAVAFAFLDIDDFKQVNDTYGHASGDAVLKTFGQLLAQNARSTDILGRLGGEEFGWLMLGADDRDASEAVSRVLEICQSLCVGSIQGFTFSAGVASKRPDGNKVPRAWDLARRADEGLYQAKADGKARIVVSQPPDMVGA